MAKTIGRNTNTNDTAVVSNGVAMDPGSTAEVVSGVNKDRLYIAITVIDKDSWIRLQPAATEPTVRKGIFVARDMTYEMPVDNVYTGEISIINTKALDKPTFYVTEY